MMDDKVFSELLSYDEEKREQFISSFLTYIEQSPLSNELKEAINSRDYNLLLKTLCKIPQDRLSELLPYIVSAGRFIYLLKQWNL